MNTAAALRWSEDRDVRACNPATGQWLSTDGTGFTEDCKWKSPRLTGHQITVVGTTWANVVFEDALRGDCGCDLLHEDDEL